MLQRQFSLFVFCLFCFLRQIRNHAADLLYHWPKPEVNLAKLVQDPCKINIQTWLGTATAYEAKKMVVKTRIPPVVNGNVWHPYLVWTKCHPGDVIHVFWLPHKKLICPVLKQKIIQNTQLLLWLWVANVKRNFITQQVKGKSRHFL